MGNPVVHFEVVGKNPQLLQKFYKQAFDWQVDPPMPELGNYAMAHPKADRSIDGGIGGGMEGYDGHVTFYVEVPDLNAALSKIQSLGGKVVMPPESIPGGPSIAQFADPEGHMIGLVQSNSGN